VGPSPTFLQLRRRWRIAVLGTLCFWRPTFAGRRRRRPIKPPHTFLTRLGDSSGSGLPFVFDAHVNGGWNREFYKRRGRMGERKGKMDMVIVSGAREGRRKEGAFLLPVSSPRSTYQPLRNQKGSRTFFAGSITLLRQLEGESQLGSELALKRPDGTVVEKIRRQGHKRWAAVA